MALEKTVKDLQTQHAQPHSPQPEHQNLNSPQPKNENPLSPQSENPNSGTPEPEIQHATTNQSEDSPSDSDTTIPIPGITEPLTVRLLLNIHDIP